MNKIPLIFSSFLLSLPCLAESIEVSNQGFEAPNLGAGVWSDSTPSWDGRHGNDSVAHPDSFIEHISGFSAEGNQHIGMQNGAYHFQDTGVFFEANKRYTLTLAIGNRSGWDEGVSGWGITNSAPPTNNTATLTSLASSDSMLGDTLVTGEADLLVGESQFAEATSVVFETGAIPPTGTVHVVFGIISGGRSHFDDLRLEVEDLGGGPGGGDPEGGLDAPEPVGPFLNGAFPETAPGSIVASDWETVNAFPNLTFTDGLWLTSYPGTNDVVVVEKTGRIYRFENDENVTSAERTVILDWRSQTETSEDQGFYSLVFHPTFGQAQIPDPADLSGSNTITNPNRGYVYVCYNRRANIGTDDNDRTYWRLSRFNIPDGSNVIDPNSETVLINQYDPNRWHNGGGLFFGPKGCLYATSGDGGGGGDPFGYSQNIDFGFFGGVYRLDVDMDMYPAGHPSDKVSSHPIRRQPQGDEPSGWAATFSANYQIPDDNPWQDPSGSTLEEFFALGLRSPHTMHYDEVSGEVWVGDVGQGTREEMTVFKISTGDFPNAGEGTNHQWAFREGKTGGPKATPSSVLGVQSVPIHDYPRSVGNCIIGGFVYRGSEFASSLGGKVLFGDHGRGRVWTLDYTEGQAPVIEEIIGDFRTGNKAGLGNFCRDDNGEVYLMDLNGTDNGGSIIRKLRAAGDPAEEPPGLLSQTGAFSDLANLVAEDFLLPYDVGSQLWSDGAKKKRWIALPNNGTHNTSAEKIKFDEEGNWEFPAGTVIVKHFELPTDENDPSVITRLETRFLVCTENGGKYGVTYRWLPDQSDAVLLTSGETGDYTINESDGGDRVQTWDFPSRSNCLLCHNDSSGQALGVRTHQLNGDKTYSATGRTANQLTTWNELGMFDQALDVASIENYLRSESMDDESVPLEHRIRSYLDSNCSHCHQPGAPGGTFDARLHTALGLQNIVNAPLERDFDLGPDDAIIKPQDVPMSAIHARLNAAQPDPVAMPPLAKNLVHDAAVQRVANWINSLDPTKFETSGGTTARYVRFTTLSEQNGEPWAAISELNILDGTGNTISQSSISIESFDSEETTNEFAPVSHILDGDPSTFWHTVWNTPDPDPGHPHWVILDLGSIRSVSGFRHLPRQAGVNGRVRDWRFEVSNNLSSWTQLGSGSFPAGTDETTWVDPGSSGVRPVRTFVGGPTQSVDDDFEVNIYFDFDVSNFDETDLSIVGGQIVELRGSGHYYSAMITPIDDIVEISLAADVVSRAGGGGSFASNLLQVTHGIQVNQPPAVVSPIPDLFVDENSPDSFIGLTPVFNDPDVGDVLAYSIEGNSNPGLVAATTSGSQLTLAYAPSSVGSADLTIRATDLDGAFAETSFQVTVNAVNHAPVAENAAFSVVENTSPGFALGAVNASDPDGGDILTYSISGGNPGGAFSIESATGIIRVAGVLDFETNSQYQLTVSVSDNGSPTLSDTAQVDIAIIDMLEIVSPTIVTGGSSNVTETTTDLAFNLTDTGGEEPSVTLYYGTANGGADPSAWQSSDALGTFDVGNYLTDVTGLAEGTSYFYTFRAVNSAGESWGSASSFQTQSASAAKLVKTQIDNVTSGSWVSVDLGQSYSSPVIIATPIYPAAGMPPVVTRIRNISSSGFEVTLQRADSDPSSVTCDVSVVVIEEGIYTVAEHGVKMEAVTYDSSITAENNNWAVDVRSYQNTYQNPVVVGQVMSVNDPDWSVFWCRGSSRSSPPTASALRVGKTVCEDPDATRASETIGYLVIEAGNGSIDGVAYSAGLGSDNVKGYSNNTTGYNLPISGLTSASAAAISQAGMDGGNGGWAVLVGNSAITPSNLRVVIDEDQLRDTERKHTTEQVGYFVLE